MWKWSVCKVRAGVQIKAQNVVDCLMLTCLPISWHCTDKSFETPQFCPGKTATGFSSCKGTSSVCEGCYYTLHPPSCCEVGCMDKLGFVTQVEDGDRKINRKVCIANYILVRCCAYEQLCSRQPQDGVMYGSSKGCLWKKYGVTQKREKILKSGIHTVKESTEVVSFNLKTALF